MICDVPRKEGDLFVKIENDLGFFFCIVQLSAAGARGKKKGNTFFEPWGAQSQQRRSSLSKWVNKASAGSFTLAGGKRQESKYQHMHSVPIEMEIT